MKFLRIALLSVASLMAAASVSADRYEVFKLTGSPVKVSASGQQALSKRTPLKPSDKVRIPTGASLSILDTSNGAIYSSDQPTDPISVAAFVVAMKKKAKKHTSALISVLSSKKGNPAQKTLGASFRGNDGNWSPVDVAVAERLLGPATLAEYPDLQLQVVRDPEDASYHFKIVNKSGNLLWANVYDPEARRLMIKDAAYEEIHALMLPPDSELDLAEYVFASDADAPRQFMLVTSTEPFDTGLVQLLLDRDALPTPDPESAAVTAPVITILPSTCATTSTK